MPTISEDGVDRTAMQFTDGDETLAQDLVQNTKIEQLMVSMLDQRDKLNDQVRLLLS